MNRLKKLLILLLLSTSVFFIYNHTKNTKYVITNIGDQLSLGINSYGIKTPSYVDYYKDYLLDTKNEVIINNTYSNKKQSISNILTLIKTTPNMKRYLYDSNLVIITLGYNDIIYNILTEENITENKYNSIMKNIIQEYEELIKEIKKYYHEQIIVVGYYDYNKDNIYINKGIKELNNYLENNKEITYINTKKLLKNRSKYFDNPSSYYPNQEAYYLISKKIIEKTLEKS
jgi:lysophospholipase L1-like esterase